MRFDEIPSSTLYAWHLASGRMLGLAVVDVEHRGLVVHLFASRADKGGHSIVVLGVHPHDGASRTYAEVSLGEEPDALRAWEHLRLQGVIEQAKAALERADRVLSGGSSSSTKGDQGRS